MGKRGKLLDLGGFSTEQKGEDGAPIDTSSSRFINNVSSVHSNNMKFNFLEHNNSKEEGEESKQNISSGVINKIG